MANEFTTVASLQGYLVPLSQCYALPIFQYAYQKAQENGVKGFVKNTQNGTIKGVLQGPKDKVADM